MDRLRQRLSRAGGERGAVLVMFAIWLPVLVLMAAFVLDIANWFVHKRHLQMQADAAALAAAADWAHPGCNDAAIDARAREYGGWGYNSQIGGTPSDEVHMLMNSRTYHGQTTPVDGTVDTRPPCQAGMVDVKLTETDLPWFFEATKVVPFINAHARVSILQADTIAGALPVGVPDSRPQKAAVTFVDETTGEVLGTRELQRSGQSGGYAFWNNSTSPLPVTVDRSRIGVRVTLSGGSSLTCGATLVDCYDTASSNGLVFIRGWQGGTVSQADNPVARDVRLLAGSCSGAYFSSMTTGCSVAVEAQIDFGTTSPADLGAEVVANVGGNRDYTLTYDPTAGVWRSNAEIPVPAQGGPVSVDLKWKKTAGTSNGNACSTKGTNPCKGTFTGVQRVFSASEPRSGPIVAARVFEAADPLVDANSLEACSASQASCIYDLAVELKIVGTLEDAQSVNDPPVALRVVGGSQNQSLDCDPFSRLIEDTGQTQVPSLDDEIATGCAPGYITNTGQACPASGSDLWALSQPWNCVAIQTGTNANAPARGLNRRVYGDPSPGNVCPPLGANRYDQNDDGIPDYPSDDKRLVPVFRVPFGSFDESGNGVVPVLGFATFYVTGWTSNGNGFGNPCKDQGDEFEFGTEDDSGAISGHFVIRIDGTGDSTPGTTNCDTTIIGGCVAVMTK